SSGEKFSQRYGRLGMTRYYSLDFLASSDGLRVSVSPPFSLGHRPFFVPWTDVRARVTKRLFMQPVRLTFRLVEDVYLDVRHPLALELEKASRGAFVLPPPS